MKFPWIFVWISLCFCSEKSAGNFAFSDLPPCPPRWVTLKDSCYWFEQGALTTWENALASCRHIGARLVSLNDENEAKLVANHLKEIDYTRKDWLTSGIYAEGDWEWQGDGTQINFLFWSDPSAAPPGRGHIAYSYNSNEYRWSTVLGSTQLPYICEVSRLSLWSVYHKNRPPEYMGLSPEAVFNKPHHPVLVEEPENVVYFGEEGPRTFISLNCRALGSPQPTVKWYKGAGGVLVDSGNSRLIQADGSLVFVNVTAGDFDSYYCVARNSFGSVRSRKIVLNHAYTKEFPETRLDVYATAGLGKRIPCEEPDHFPQSLGYGWMYESVKKFVRESTRIFISRSDGSLYFSFLKKEDRNSYSCNIVSSELQTGHYGPFFNLRVADAEAGVAKQFPPKISVDFLRIYPREPQLDRAVWLECFAYGRPAPTYAWTRKNGHLPLKARLKNYGRVLFIPNLESDDVGDYQCQATNSLGSDAKTISLDFLSRPILLTELRHQFQEANSSAFFFCKAFGRPEVEYEWFHNGGPISPLLLPPGDQNRITVDRNRLIIINLQPRDSGVYQCVASNSLGQEVSSGYLAVRNFNPTFAKEIRNKVQHGIEGNVVDIRCDVEASPRPSFSWRKNGFPVKYSSHYSLLDSGTLRIHEAETSDAGEYTCTATNEYGSDFGSISLYILADLKLEMTKSVRLSAGENKTLVCSVKNACKSADLFHCPELSYSWTFNGESVWDLPQFTSSYYTNSQEESMFPLREVGSVHSGTYMCRLDTPGNHVSQSASVMVDTVPATPIRIRVGSPTRNSVKISWKLPLNSGGAYEGELDAYRIEALIAGNDTQWRIVSERLNTFHPEVRDFELVGLRAYTEYKFRVFAHNEQGWSLPSLPSQTVRTKSDKPNLAVTGLTVSSPNIGDILVMWEPLPRSRWGDSHLGYVIEWEEGRANQSSFQNQHPKGSVSLGMGAPTAYVIRTRDRKNVSDGDCRFFRVTVCAFNSNGRGPQAGSKEITLSHKAPEHSPRFFAAEAFNSTHIKFAWNWEVSVRAGCETVSSFKISCGSTETETVTHLVGSGCSAGNEYNVTRGGFHPFIWYQCSICAIAGGLKGPHSSVVRVLTFKSAPRKASKTVELVRNGDKKYVQLRWTKVPDQLRLQEAVVGYKLFLYHGGSASISQEFDIPVSLLNAPKYPTIRLKGLQPLQLYRTQVAAYSLGGLGPASQPLTFRFGLSSAAGSFKDLKTFVLIQTVSVLFCLYHQRLLLFRC